jgi:hypothetical protein
MTALKPTSPIKLRFKLKDPSPDAKPREKIQLIRSVKTEKEKEEPPVPQELPGELKEIHINLEPYIDDYIQKNYFKIHTLLPFQKRGNDDYLFLSLYPPLSISIYPPLSISIYPPVSISIYPPLSISLSTLSLSLYPPSLSLMH